jgi:hypothetical protein
VTERYSKPDAQKLFTQSRTAAEYFLPKGSYVVAHSLDSASASSSFLYRLQCMLILFGIAEGPEKVRF